MANTKKHCDVKRIKITRVRGAYVSTIHDPCGRLLGGQYKFETLALLPGGAEINRPQHSGGGRFSTRKAALAAHRKLANTFPKRRK